MREKLSRFWHEERVAFQRRQSAWEAYLETGRRFDSAYHLMLWTRDDFENAKDEMGCGCENEILLKLAEKRYRSAEEEFQYQRVERSRAQAELESARRECRRWRRERGRKATKSNKPNADSMSEVVAN